MVNMNYPIKRGIKNIDIVRARKPKISEILIQISKSEFVHIAILVPPIYEYMLFRFDLQI